MSLYLNSKARNEHIDKAKRLKPEEHQSKSFVQSVHSLEDIVFRNTVPRLRGRASLEDMLDSGLFFLGDKDERNMFPGTSNSKRKAASTPQQSISVSRAEIQKVYHDAANEMHQFPTSLLRWNDLVVTDRGINKEANFEDNQQKELFQSSDENRQKQQQKEKRQSQMQQPHDEYVIGKYDDPNVISSMLSDGSKTATISSQEERTPQRKGQTDKNKTEAGDSSNSTSALLHQQNNTFNFAALLAPTTNQQRQERNSTGTIVVLPEGPMLRGGRNINSDSVDSMSFGTLVTGRYESPGDTAEKMDVRPGLSNSDCFPVASLLILLLFVALWSKATQRRSHI